MGLHRENTRIVTYLNYQHVLSPSFCGARKLLCIRVSARALSPEDIFLWDLYQHYGQMPVSQIPSRDNWLLLSRHSVHTTEASKILIFLLINTLQSYVILERVMGWQNLGPIGSWDLRGIGGEKAYYRRGMCIESETSVIGKKEMAAPGLLLSEKACQLGILFLGFFLKKMKC